MFRHRVATVALSGLLALALSAPAQDLTDPYEILNRHFEARGGLDRLKAELASYSEGALTLGGLEGTLKTWVQQPYRNRLEIDLRPLNFIQGDNGEYQWVLDSNGKLQKITNPDQATANRRIIRQLLAEFAYADPDSDVFTASLEGVQGTNGSSCYVIKVTNNLNVDSYTSFINVETFLQDKAVYIEDDESRDAFYRDYRDVDGLLVPFWTREVQHQTGQTQETRLSQYVSNPSVEPTRFEPPEEGRQDYQFVDGTNAENIPFRYIGSHVYISVNVGGKERLWAIDTGAAMSVLNRAFAEQLGLPLEGSLAGQGAGGTVEATFTRLPPFRVANIQFREQTVAVMDMNELIRRVGVDMVGILGFDFLSRFVTRVDFANELVSFYDPKTFEYTGDGKVMDIHIQNSQFEVPATLDGAHSGVWLFDLGAGGVFLDGCYARREGFADRPGKVAMGHGAGNEYQTKSIMCDSIQFAGYTVYSPEIDFSYGGTDTTFTADRIGVIGNTLFRNFVLYIDYAGERLIVEKGDKFNQRWPEDRSGLQIAWTMNRDGIEVTYVSPTTPADKAGFRKGDRLKSINGLRAALLDGVIAVRELLKADPGTQYEVVVERGEKEEMLQLELAELF